MLKKKELYNIMCDGCGRPLEEEWTDDKSNLDNVKKNLDWAEVNGKHYCTDCQLYDDEDGCLITKDQDNFVKVYLLIKEEMGDYGWELPFVEHVTVNRHEAFDLLNKRVKHFKEHRDGNSHHLYIEAWYRNDDSKVIADRII